MSNRSPQTREKTMNSSRSSSRRKSLASLLAVVGLAVTVLACAGSASADPAEFDIQEFSASLSTLQAGGHPDLAIKMEPKTDSSSGTPIPVAEIRDIITDLPAGLTANPANAPTCPFFTFIASAQFTTNPPCSPESQVGLVKVNLIGETGDEVNPVEALYNLPSPEDEVARLGFIALAFPITFEIDLRSGEDYGVTVQSHQVPDQLKIRGLEVKTWGVPADSSHDTERLTPLESVFCKTPCLVGGSRASELTPQPFTTNPVKCGPTEFGLEMTAYQLPGQVFSRTATAGAITGCEKVHFDPNLAISPTNRRAGAPTGLEAILEMPQDEAVNTLGTSPLRDLELVLPPGMTANASSADGLESCSVEQVGFGFAGESNCPSQSKLGSVEITSPPLRRPIQGGLYLRTPEPGHLFRFWLVSDELGVHLKLPAEVKPDPSTGQLTAIVDESPQLPASKVVLRLNGGPRAPLRNPTSCGTTNASYRMVPWSGSATATGVVPIEINSGCGPLGFSPRLSAGTASPAAGGHSPFSFEVAREDGEQNLSSLDVSLPQGLTAKLAGVPLCGDAAAATGACPSGSRIGSVSAAVGAGTLPLWIPQAGKQPTALYLAGPYKGAPFSAVATVPAQAGPFDLGIVTVRSGIYVDRETAQVTVKSDPLPQILEGIPIDYRNVKVDVDREQFTLNPTSCAEKFVSAVVRSISGTTATATDRFQAADCASLGFAPKLSLRLQGGTQRSDHPRLRAVLKAKAGQANIRRIRVALPHSEFLDQAHIRTICTRVQFAADSCPKGAIYGRATVFTPLLDKPLKGNVYLRSSSNQLPDMVLDLRGELDVALVGRIDSINGGLRATFDMVPDAPVRKAVLEMKGGKKGLFVNSVDLCRTSKKRATVDMGGQNGKSMRSRPILAVDCAGA
jgi:hypothetical protein